MERGQATSTSTEGKRIVIFHILCPRPAVDAVRLKEVKLDAEERKTRATA